jgi:hypothetical protein
MSGTLFVRTYVVWAVADDSDDETMMTTVMMVFVTTIMMMVMSMMTIMAWLFIIHRLSAICPIAQFFSPQYDHELL